MSGDSNTTEIEAKVEVNGEEQVAKCTVTVEETVIHSIGVTVTPTTIRIGNTATAATKGYGVFGKDLGEITTGVTYAENHEGDTAIANVSGSTIEGAAVGTATITANYGNLSDNCTITIENPPVELGTLGSTIHGQFIDLGVDLDDSGSTGDDWKIVYNDTDNDVVYVFTNELLKVERVPTNVDNLTTSGEYIVKSGTNMNKGREFVNALKNNTIWRDLIKNKILEEYSNIQIKGGLELGNASTQGTMNYITDKIGGNYLPSNISSVGGGYWIATLNLPNPAYPYNAYYVNNSGTINSMTHTYEMCGVCPVAILPSNILVTSTRTASSIVWHVVTETNP